MQKVGVPSAKDVKALKVRIEALSAQVAGAAGARARQTPSRRSASAKRSAGPAAKTAAKGAVKKSAKRAARKSAA